MGIWDHSNRMGADKLLLDNGESGIIREKTKKKKRILEKYKLWWVLVMIGQFRNGHIVLEPFQS